jgi:hypothetical protein
LFALESVVNGFSESKEVEINYRSNANDSRHKLRIRQLRYELHCFLEGLVRRLITLGPCQGLAQPIENAHPGNANFPLKVREAATSCLGRLRETASQNERIGQLANAVPDHLAIAEADGDDRALVYVLAIADLCITRDLLERDSLGRRSDSECVRRGRRTIEEVKAATRAGLACGSCGAMVCEIVEWACGGQNAACPEKEEALPGSDREHELQSKYGKSFQALAFYKHRVLDHLNSAMREFITVRK